MMRMEGLNLKPLAMLLLAGGLGAYWFSRRPVTHPPGVLVAQEPAQSTPPLERGMSIEGWQVQPLADYDITARLLSKERYRSDASAAIAPWDFALGWGCMSDTRVLEKLKISQSGRWFHWNYQGEPPVEPAEIALHSANVHMIPANQLARKHLDSVREGEVVRLTGALVTATPPGGSGRPWTSSLTRDDDGNGACEVMLVRSVLVIPTP
jgi:hypothetical protein